MRIRTLKRPPGDEQTYDGDSVASGATVPLKHDVTTRVDGDTVVLVMNRAIERQSSLYESLK